MSGARGVLMLVLGEIVGWEALLVVLVIALVFGSSKIPELARSLGQASHEFRKGTEEGGDERAGDVDSSDDSNGEAR